MRRLLTVLVLAGALAAVLPAALSLSPVPQDDAGSGGDAPDAPGGAGVAIASGVAYSGALADGDMHDVYSFVAPAGALVEVRVQGAYGCYAVEDAAGVDLAHACAPAPYVEAPALFVSIPTGGTWFLHYENVPADAYRFSVGVGEPAAAPLAGPSTPSLPTADAEQDDAASGGDAPNTMSDRVRIASGVLYHGRLGGLVDGDEDDWYAFHADAGDVVQARVRGAVNCYYLHTPAGEEIDFNCSTLGLDAAADPVLEIVAATSGTHFLSVSYFDPHDYRFGIGINEPAPAILFPMETPLDGMGVLAAAPPASLWDRAADEGSPIDLSVYGTPVRLHVADHDALVAPGVVLPAEAAGTRILAGESDAGAEVRATLFADGTYVAHLFQPRLGMVTMATRLDGSAVMFPEHAFRPLAGQPFDVEAEPALAPGEMGGCLRPVPTRLANPVGLVAGWPERTFDVAYAVDDDFVALYGSSWAAQALAYANAIDGFYQSQIDMGVRVADLHAHAAGVIEGATTDELLVTTPAHYEAAHPNLARENVNLFSGVPLSGVVGQAACIGAAGDAATAYTVGLATPEDPFIFQGLTWFADQTIKIASHEMGHILSAHHHYASCAAERVPYYDPLETLDVCTLMINDIGLASMQFSTVNKLTTRGWSEHAGL